MFTGIIEEVGTIASINRKGGGIRLRVTAPHSAEELRINDSVAINGVCQTVVFKEGETFEVVAVEETLKKTTFGAFTVDNRVNLELPMRLNERLGGHLVLGHVDGVGEVVGMEPRETSTMYTVQFPKIFSRYVVPVGSIAIDGVSLTIAEVEQNRVRVSIIPHTMEKTIFPAYRVGTNVNLEFDLIGKYIERMMIGDTQQTKLTEAYLREQGY